MMNGIDIILKYAAIISSVIALVGLTYQVYKDKRNSKKLVVRHLYEFQDTYDVDTGNHIKGSCSKITLFIYNSGTRMTAISDVIFITKREYYLFKFKIWTVLKHIPKLNKWLLNFDYQNDDRSIDNKFLKMKVENEISEAIFPVLLPPQKAIVVLIDLPQEPSDKLNISIDERKKALDLYNDYQRKIKEYRVSIGDYNLDYYVASKGKM